MNKGLFGLPQAGIRARVAEKLPSAAEDGDLVLIRGGDQTPFTNVAGTVVSMPLSHVLMCYDGASGRWYSDSIMIMAQDGADWGFSSGGVEVEWSADAHVSPRRVFIQNFLALWKAGLRPQIEICGWSNGSGAGSQYYFYAACLQQNYDDSSGSWTGILTTPVYSVSWNDSTDRYKTSGWCDFSPVAAMTTQKHANIYIVGKMTGSTAGALRGMQMWFRWASVGGAIA